MDESISIVVVCDDHLAIMLSVLLKSIDNNYNGKQVVDIYIVCDSIREKNKEKIKATVLSERIKLIWLSMNDVIPPHLQLPDDDSTYPLCIFVRLFIPYFVPESVNRVIYLDVDMMVQSDITDLWTTDIGDYPIGAVVCRSGTVSSPWGGIKNYRELGLLPDTKYFNSGLLLINLISWRKHDFTPKILRAISQNRAYVTFPDQYGLNIVFANSWYELDYRWNNFSQYDNVDPFIVHFTQVKPIFQNYNFNMEYKRLFFDVLGETPWNGFTPKSQYVSIGKRARTLIKKGEWGSLVGKVMQLVLGRSNV